MTKKYDIAFYDKYLLTVDEAAAYFHIGNKKFYEIIQNHPGSKWILRNGKRMMIKKDMFAKWLDAQEKI